MGNRACFFCGSSDKLTSSHVIARRFLKALPGTDERAKYYEHTSASHSGGSDPLIRETNTDPREEKVNLLCGTCNNVWMHGHEDAVAQVLVDLASGVPIVLSSEDQEILCKWVTIASMIRGAVTAFDKVSLRDRKAIRSDDRIPYGYKFWIVQGDDRTDWPRRFQHLTTPRNKKGWTACFWIGQVILIVATELCAVQIEKNLIFHSAVRERIGYGRSDITWPLSETASMSYEDFMRRTQIQMQG